MNYKSRDTILLNEQVHIPQNPGLTHAVESSVVSKFLSLFEHADIGFAKIGLSGEWLETNEKLCQMTGYSKEELFHKSISSMSPPDESKIDEARVEKYLQGKVPPFIVRERRILRKDGTELWVHISATLIENQRNEPQYFICLIEDIDERKRTEKKLRDSDERYRLVEIATNDTIWDWDLKTNQLYWNKNLETTFKYRHEDIYPQSHKLDWWLNHVHPDDRERADLTLKQSIETKKQFWRQEYRFLRGDGSYAYVIDRGYIALDEHGEPCRMIGAMSDITQRKEGELLVKESEERFRSLSEAAPFMIWITDNAGQTTYTNKAWRDFSGQSLEGSTHGGWGWAQALSETERQRTLEKFIAAFNTQQFFEAEFIAKRSDGELRWILSQGTPHYTPDNQFAGYIGNCIDITERKLAEEENNLLQSIIFKMNATDNIDSALQVVLKEVCNVTGWVLAQAWVPEEKNAHLKLSQAWYSTQTNLFVFHNKNFEYHHPPGSGLPGRVWASQKPFWLKDVAHDPNFPRRQLAQDFNLKSAVAFPVLSPQDLQSGSPEKVIVVVEFFMDEIHEENKHYVDLISSITSQLGLFIQSKKAEQALRESEMRFRSIAEAAPVMIWLMGPDNLPSYFNHASIEFLGEKASTYLQSKAFAWADVVHPDDLQNIIETRQAALINRSFFNIEGRLKRQDGVYRWVLISSGPRFVDNVFQGYVASGIDITEHKEAEKALKESEQLFKVIADSVPTMIWMTGPDKGVTFLNKVWADYTGIPLEKALGEQWIKAFHPDDVAKAMSIYNNAFDKREPFTFEARELHHSGHYRWVLATGIPRYDNLNRFAGYIGTCIDIEDRKAWESSLRESERRFKAMADSAPFMILMSDLKTNRIYFNQTWREYTGFTFESAYGIKRWYKVIHPEDRRTLLNWYKEALTLEKPRSIEFRIRRYDNEYHWVYASALPRYSEDNQLLGIIASCFDIQERKEAEQKVMDLTANLEKKVTDRTAELAAVNQELEAFSYSVSHDLRAPLRGIDGISQAVLEDYEPKLDDQGKHYLHILRNEAQHMSQLIDEMLNLSRLTRGTIHPQDIDLSQMVHQIADELVKENPQRHVEFVIQDGVMAKADAHLMQAVLENLIGNAWKFTSKHESARIEFGMTRENNENVYFVKDNGAGFDMAYTDKLFVAFQRLHTVEEFPGNGIGLATVQRIIHRHGGRIWATGEVEKGAQFFFTLGELNE